MVIWTAKGLSKKVMSTSPSLLGGIQIANFWNYLGKTASHQMVQHLVGGREKQLTTQMGNQPNSWI